MKKIRTFIAHPVPEEWREIIGTASAELHRGLKSRIAWVKPENLHFTIKFLGDVPEDTIPSLHAALQEIPFTPFDITAGNPGFFPGHENPRIIWIGMNRGAQEFCTNATEVDLKLANLSFERNQKAWHAHLTIGRVKTPAHDDWVALARRIKQIELPAAHISGFNLYQSILTPEGPEYSVLHTYGN
ncbi:RNA 2',3'-cyclic phosphodiesterase [Maridesulfovibrio sp. FT414]|uniref:RNA 2',3'-cyclic phosphodiesterase n=1 Tax=Maridesulfovibrio sp. FT414 TaxID=2979469 RepID=UPI003D8067D4